MPGFHSTTLPPRPSFSNSSTKMGTTDEHEEEHLGELVRVSLSVNRPIGDWGLNI